MKILEQLKIIPVHPELYKQAFTHTSYAHENKLPSYERLEFLGDAVLELVMSEYLFNKEKNDEGTMTKLRAHYVCETALYDLALKIGLNEYILLGKGEIENGKIHKAIIADVFEAFMGAIYLDQGLEMVKKFFYSKVIPFIENEEVAEIIDYKSSLQELVQTDKRTLEYIVINESGPSHKKIFTINVKIDNLIYGQGTAYSKKEAEQLAAKDALKKAQRSIYIKG
ncbi:MAG: ribonuclease III [Bacilli bacterium]